MQADQEERTPPQEKQGGASALTIAAIVILILIVGAAYYLIDNKEQAVEPELPITVTQPEVVPEEPLVTDAEIPEPEVVEPESEIIEVIEEPVVNEEALPELIDSDRYAVEKALAAANGMEITPILVEQDVIRHFVVFVDNLAQGELARKVSPVKAPKTDFTVTDVSNKTYLNPDSYHRYDIYADLVSNLDEQKLIETYHKLMPLLDQAFEELGYENSNFNNQMLKAIDVILDAPIIEHPIELSTISVNYQFVDPELESLPNAQKLMIRMGPENAKKVKAAMRKLKQQLK